jgi:hypothetical protein
MEKTHNDYYYSLFCKWQESGMTKSAFAASQGISRFSFYYWCKKFGQDSIPAGQESGFTRVAVCEQDPSSPAVRIAYPNGVVVELFGSLDSEKIKSLVF